MRGLLRLYSPAGIDAVNAIPNATVFVGQVGKYILADITWQPAPTKNKGNTKWDWRTMLTRRLGHLQYDILDEDPPKWEEVAE